MLKHRIPPVAPFAALLALAGGSALAQEVPQPSAAGVATLHWSQTPQAGEANPADVLAPAEPSEQAQAASDQVLDGLSGRGADTNVGVALTEQSLSAVNTGNTINAGQLVTGAISVQDSALSGFSGIGNIMMNTGANNNLQSTMSVTIVITP